MDAAAILSEVERVFPYVEKPIGLDLSFHKDECAHCQYLRDDLWPYQGSILPPAALRTICRELSCLSSQGWRWMLPSYLRHCLLATNTDDDIETEFFIYSLGPEKEYVIATREHFNGLNQSQVECLIHFLEWCANHKHWAEYCPDEIAKALAFVRAYSLNLTNSA